MKTKTILYIFICFMILSVVVFPFCVYKHFNQFSEPYIYSKLTNVPKARVALVLGAQVYKNKRISYILYDRVISAIELYRQHKVLKLILSGDHGRKEYDEVNTMKYYVVNDNIDPKDVFLDHAGFDTYDSIIRAKKIFEANDIVIVTQRFHLPRAIFIARKRGLKAFGFVADKRQYAKIKSYKIREMFASVKALIEVVFGSNPKYLGAKIPIDGDGRLSWD